MVCSEVFTVQPKPGYSASQTLTEKTHGGFGFNMKLPDSGIGRYPTTNEFWYSRVVPRSAARAAYT